MNTCRPFCFHRSTMTYGRMALAQISENKFTMRLKIANVFPTSFVVDITAFFFAEYPVTAWLS